MTDPRFARAQPAAASPRGAPSRPSARTGAGAGSSASGAHPVHAALEHAEQAANRACAAFHAGDYASCVRHAVGAKTLCQALRREGARTGPRARALAALEEIATKQERYARQCASASDMLGSARQSRIVEPDNPAGHAETLPPQCGPKKRVRQPAARPVRPPAAVSQPVSPPRKAAGRTPRRTKSQPARGEDEKKGGRPPLLRRLLSAPRRKEVEPVKSAGKRSGKIRAPS